MSKNPKLPLLLPEEPEGANTTTADRPRETAIRASILKQLGRPDRLFRVAVVHLWNDNYRVNVVIGDEATAVSIPNSYFVTADARGDILRSQPPIQKLYALN